MCTKECFVDIKKNKVMYYITFFLPPQTPAHRGGAQTYTWAYSDTQKINQSILQIFNF